MTSTRSGTCAALVTTLLLACTPGNAAKSASVTATTKGPSPSANASAKAAAATPVDGIRTRFAAGLGRYLTDASGRALYMFERDGKYMSACVDECAAAWPPAPSSGSADPVVESAMLGGLSRQDGARQGAYNGMPLYYYEDDERPGDILGQGKLEFGGLWHLVSPDGRPIDVTRQRGSWTRRRPRIS